MQTHDKELVRIIRNIERLKRERRKLQRRLRDIKKELKLENRHQKALVSQLIGSDPMVPPMRLFGEAPHLK